MQTTDTNLLFQTTAQIAQGEDRNRKKEAAKDVGKPVQVGKVIKLLVEESEVFVAESGWQARRVSLKTGKTIRTYRGHQGPVTSVALHVSRFPDGTSHRILFTGSWDKTINVWEVETGVLLTTLRGHTDFVKSLTVLPRLLISTSSDRTIRLWDLGLIPEIGVDSISSVQTIKAHTRPVDRSVAATTSTGSSSTHLLWTADSMGVIHEWKLDGGQLGLIHSREMHRHETSVTDLLPVEDGLWSVSMDKSAQFHSFESTRVQTIPHESSVHSVLLLPEVMTSRSIMLTGSDDEDVRVWETEDDWETYTLLSRVQGHCGPVTSIRHCLDEEGKSKVITGALDGTLRSWSLSELLNPPALNYAPESTINTHMTKEEEEELAELMSDDEFL